MSRRNHTPKITGGAWKGRPLIGGVPRGVRPTSSKIREALGSRYNDQFQGAYVLDAFAGAGLFSAEALSRGASRVVALDNNARAIDSIRKSMANLNVDMDLILRCGDIRNFLRQSRPANSPPFDMVFIDPPYASDLVYPTLTLLVSGNWIHHKSSVIVESSSRHEPPPPPGGLAILDTRRYGDTQISSYCLEQNEGQES